MTGPLSRLQDALRDRYRIERELGSGGMATVFLARDRKHDRPVAIKVLRSEIAAAVGSARFLREIQITAALQHPHILPLHDSGSVDDLLYYVMPYVEGESLRDRLDREGALPLEDAVRIAGEVASALEYAHARDVVHRDIKPENILLSGGHAMVADFGIARAVHAAGEKTLTQTGVVIGTPSYMSPEQVTGGKVDARTDVYALAAVVHEMVGGSPPFREATSQALMQRILSDPPPGLRGIRATVPEVLEQTVARGLAKVPADRFGDIGSFAAQLRRSVPAQTDSALGVTPPSGVQPVPPASGGPGPVRVGLVYVGASAAMLAAAWLLMIQFGLPDWVFLGAAALLMIGFPTLLATAVVQGRAAPEGVTVSMTAQATARRWLSWRRALLGGAAGFLLLGLLAAGYMVSRKTGLGPAASLVSAGVLEERDRILVADFVAEDAVLGQTLQQALIVDLSQSPVVTVLSSAEIGEVLTRMQRPPRTPVDADLAHEIASREGIKAFIAGEVHPAGKGYLITAQLLGTGSDAIHLAVRESAPDADGLIPAVDRLSKKIRERIGESLKTIRATKSLEQVTTHSIEALRKYTQALQAAEQEGDIDLSKNLLEQAVEEDSTFAMAWRKLAVYLGNQGQELVRAKECLRRAYELRDRLTEREKYFAIAAYFQWALGDEDRAAAAYKSLLEIDPQNTWALNNLGNIHKTRGEFSRALDLYHRAMRSGPEVTLLFNVAQTQMLAGDVAAADSALASMRRDFPANPMPRMLTSVFLGATGHYAEAERRCREVRERWPGNNQVRVRTGLLLSSLHVIQGRLAEAKAFSETRRRQFREQELPGSALTDGVDWGFVDLFVRGDPERALEDVNEAIREDGWDRIDPPDRPYVLLATLCALAGDPGRARGLIAEYESEVDAGTRQTETEYRHGAFGHLALGAIAQAEGRVEDAIREYRAMVQGNSEYRLFSLPCIALAEEMAGNAPAAIDAYEQYLGATNLFRPFGDRFFLGGTLLRLGDLHAEAGHPEKAAYYYDRLATLWENADEELQHRVRYARNRVAELTGTG